MAAHHGHGHAISAVKRLQMELKSLQAEPVEGFRVKLLNDENLFQWQVAIFGPPKTLYQGGYFKANMEFPKDYPYSPPTLRFTTKLWHPNVYENGDVCISILHPPTDDPQSGELPQERWNPTQSVNNILLSVISLLNEPNTFSPANVDASVMYRRWKDSQGKDNDYERIVKKQIADSVEEAKKDAVVVPTTVDEYIIRPKPKPMERDEDLYMMEFGPDSGPFEDDDDMYGAECEDDEDAQEEAEEEQCSDLPQKPSSSSTSGPSSSHHLQHPHHHHPPILEKVKEQASSSSSGSRSARAAGSGATADDSGSEMS